MEGLSVGGRLLGQVDHHQLVRSVVSGQLQLNYWVHGVDHLHLIEVVGFLEFEDENSLLGN